MQPRSQPVGDAMLGTGAPISMRDSDQCDSQQDHRQAFGQSRPGTHEEDDQVNILTSGARANQWQ